VANRGLTGVLLVGGDSSRFGSPKALASIRGRTLAEIAWETLSFCSERLAVGKASDRLDLPFPVLDDGSAVRAPIAGVVAGVRAARHEVCVVIPVDMPRLTAVGLGRLARACVDAAVPVTGPLPGAYAKSALPVLERRLRSGDLALRDALAELDVVQVELDSAELLNVNTTDELAAL
jgi:molybdopterin-guanine dinucleotide biosynthesis protein A